MHLALKSVLTLQQRINDVVDGKRVWSTRPDDGGSSIYLRRLELFKMSTRRRRNLPRQSLNLATRQWCRT